MSLAMSVFEAGNQKSSLGAFYPLGKDNERECVSFDRPRETVRQLKREAAGNMPPSRSVALEAADVALRLRAAKILD